MAQQNEFRRANMMMDAIRLLMVAHTGVLLQQEIQKLGPYESRGKGGKYRPNGSRRKVYLKMLRQNGGGGIRGPHQGKREIARRLAQQTRRA